MQNDSMTVTVPEAGRLLGISRRSAYGLARAGAIPVLRLGRRVVVPRLALERLLRAAADLGDGDARETLQPVPTSQPAEDPSVSIDRARAG